MVHTVELLCKSRLDHSQKSDTQVVDLREWSEIQLGGTLGREQTESTTSLGYMQE